MTAPAQAPPPVAGLPTRPPGEPALAAPTLLRQRFRAADVALNLDMSAIGNVCVAVSLSGYRSVLEGFLNDTAGSQATLLVALDGGQTAALAALAHAVLGAAASLGLRAVAQQARRIEVEAARFQLADCKQHAAELRMLLATARALLQRMGFA